MAGSGTDGRPDLPGEHGFRFFPHFDWHLPDTMARIPFAGNGDGVRGNLVAAPRGPYAREGQVGVEVDTGLPRSRADLELMLHNWLHDTMQLDAGDFELFGKRMWQLLTSSKWRRIAEYEAIVWTDFIDADRRSPQYAAWFGSAMTRTLIAASGDQASARTVGDVLIQLLIGSVIPGASDDRLLNGPTNEVWIDPWRAYLASRGVTFQSGARAVRIHCDAASVTGVDIDSGSATTTITADVYVLAVPVEMAARLLDDTAVALDSSLDRIPQLATHVQWMNGIQLFVTEDVPLVHGHVVFVNSPWGLTAVSQQQFWPNVRLGDRGDGTVRGVLSVDISRWDCPGVVPGAGLGKTARECSFEEIRDEVWGELERWLNIGGDPVLRKGTLHSAALDSDIIPFVAGVPATNNEPLLVNDRGTWGLRPDAHTRIRTSSSPPTTSAPSPTSRRWRAANEAARRATNAILGATGSTARPCEVRDPHEPSWLWPFRAADARRFRRGLPWRDAPLHPAARALVRVATVRGGRGARGGHG